jgi:hypothetical protein
MYLVVDLLEVVVEVDLVGVLLAAAVTHVLLQALVHNLKWAVTRSWVRIPPEFKFVMIVCFVTGLLPSN